MNREKMENLKRVAELLDLDGLDMGNWGTCLAAHAVRDKYFERRGLDKNRLDFEYLARFFGITTAQSLWLFGADYYAYSKPAREELLEHIDDVLNGVYLKHTEEEMLSSSEVYETFYS